MLHLQVQGKALILTVSMDFFVSIYKDPIPVFEASYHCTSPLKVKQDFEHVNQREYLLSYLTSDI